LGIGIAPVKVPGYLFKQTMAMRRETNEVVYLDTAHWAERLDVGLQRVLAADLGAILATDRVRLSTWRPDEISVVVSVRVEQFDVDASGNAVLTAWWRLQSANGDHPAAGRFSASRKGPAPDVDPGGAVNSLNALASSLAEELAREIRGRKS
jgi:uncharacterized lipoprotein YmbA